MNTAQDFDRILEECLAALTSGESSLDECLARYPAQAEELRPLLQVALLTKRLKVPAMPASKVDALETRLRNQPAPVRPIYRPNFLAPYQKLAAMIALVFVLTVGTGAGAVAASANSVPGDFLYPLKRLWEAIMLALASLNASQDDVWLRLAETRLDEAERLAEFSNLNAVVWIDLYEATAQSIALVDEETAPQLLDYLDKLDERISRLPVTIETERLRGDVLLMILPSERGGLPMRPASLVPPSLFTPGSDKPDAPTPTASPTETSTATATPSATPTDTPTPTLNVSPTSRVAATATDTATVIPASSTPVPSATPLPSATASWTPLPLPGASLTERPDQLATRGAIQRQTATAIATIDQSATVRYRDTQAAIYATQTAQADDATEEVRP